MQVRIDAEQCEGHGRCQVTAPEVFRLDAEGYGQVAVDDVPEEYRAPVERAIRLCPKQAIMWVRE